MSRGVVSWSQVGEDLQLAYLLGRGDNVTYLDVGCLWPREHSNSFFFYERGGSGLCIDANPDVASEWAADRPRDVFVAAALGSEPGQRTYHRFANPVFNTFSDARAERLERRGRQRLDSTEMETTTLDAVIEQTRFAERCGGEVDVLSLDVQGLEEDVLAGFDFRTVRPRAVVCELQRRHVRTPVEDAPLVRRIMAHGYTVAGWTGHDVYLMSA